MKEIEKEETFIETARHLLSECAAEMDARTRSRLRESRYAALQSRRSRKQTITWIWPVTGMAVAGMALLAFFLFLKEPGAKVFISNMEDIELLASSEPIAFYDDLEFYGWLAKHEGAG